ncbi:type I-E CRISPR-associated protein Cas6/Cse3/CasE, partial [Frankia sp. CIT1]|uniref:type I-E CRISPR-associated protein Cas6/Cse3/CasE n=1 Tax=Frankia sp. CIT1 TaxID=2880974 RepID=UPI001EF55132
CYRQHQRISGLFSGLDGRALWMRPSPGMLLIQGPAPITTGMLPRGYALTAEHDDLDTTLGGLRAGQRVRFTTVVNPTNRPTLVNGQKNRGRRPMPEVQRDDWIRGYLAPAVVVEQLSGQDIGTARGRKQAGPPISLVWHWFAGEGLVVDPVALGRFMVCGVGHGRAFGCGLLDVRVTTEPDGPVPARSCPGCATRILVLGEVECPRCHVGVTATDGLAGFTMAAFDWWRPVLDRQCITKRGLQDEGEARSCMEAAVARKAPPVGAGVPTAWHCLLCDRWHWGYAQPHTVTVGPAVADVFRAHVAAQREVRWNRADRSLPEGAHHAAGMRR